MHRSLYICDVLTGHQTNLVLGRHCCTIGHVSHACKSDKVCEYAMKWHYQAVEQLK